MGNHPANLALRFLLELTALFIAGLWGWNQNDSWMRYILVLSIPLTLAVIWGVFAVPNDPSRSGNAPIPTPGFIRLIIEILIFGFAVWSLYDLELIKLALGLGILVVLHYIISYDRIIWIISK